MTIQEVVANLQSEKQNEVPSRFPCRAIMVSDISQYCELLSELKKISDIHFVQTQELFTNADVMPKYENLKADSYRDKWIVLTGVSEYLRLFSKSELDDRRFATLWGYQAPASSKGRIIIPLWGCEAQWFDSALNLTSDLRQLEFFIDCSQNKKSEQIMRLIVFSGKFEKYISMLESVNGDLKIGLQDWFEYWLDPVPNKTDFVLLTKRYRSVNTTDGNISIHVISDTLSLIHENMKGSAIFTASNCSEEMQDVLLKYALKGVDVENTLLSIMNMSEFSWRDIMSKWKMLNKNTKSFVKAWYQLHPDNTYISYCFSITDDVSKLDDVAKLTIFKTWTNRKNWVEEYRYLAEVMDFTPDESYFNELDKIPLYEERLNFIVGFHNEVRLYLLRMVGKWLRYDKNQVFSSPRLRELYPEIIAYINDEELSFDDDIKFYFSKYRSYKLENVLPDDENIYFNGIQTDIYDMRYSVLSDYIDSDTIVLWIDALGVEWFPILHWAISKYCDCDIVKEEIVQACLPTETKFNDQWEKMANPHEKLDKLDKLAHKGMSFFDDNDYYSCVAEQLKFVSDEIPTKIDSLLEKYKRVIITGDHGTSRLAARFFHKRDAMPLPKHAVSCSHGRYCLLGEFIGTTSADVCITQTIDGKKFMMFRNYDHFTQPGYAAGGDDDNAIYGEVHGGATPEEMLVPIIVLDSKCEIPLAGKWSKNIVKIAMKKVKLNIEFNKSINNLQVRIAGIDGITTVSTDPKIWNIVFRGLNPGTYTAQVYADSKILDMPEITVKPALGGGEGDLP